ncbi:MAG TPA: PepSY-associated TM helix domain-containing protein, partial [Bordetella sp.]|nr:PepSY-associated TM helix domain-containing protein [Bordetella sp.]
PWYLTMVLLSQPLHFGDYGGMPLKVLWILLDLVAIGVLGSGLVLWWARGDAVRRRNAAACPQIPTRRGSGRSACGRAWWAVRR